MAATEKPIVFISCGQQTEEERSLGRRIAALVAELTPFEPYFAEDQTSVEGLTQNIFAALHDAAGFIAVMQTRGTVFSDPLAGDAFQRASVFVEQEIAIAAFIRQALGREIRVAAYIAPQIKREGVRGYIIFNPKMFTTADEILADLARVLPAWQATVVTRRPPLELTVEVVWS